MIHIYTDGSFSKKRNKGSYAVLAFEDQSKEAICRKRGIVRFATSNKCELLGLINALKMCLNASRGKAFTIHCDSQYCVNSYNRWMDGWKSRNWRKSNRKPVKNLDYVQELYELKEKLTHQSVNVVWVRGHDGDVRNEMADEAAKELVYE